MALYNRKELTALISAKHAQLQMHAKHDMDVFPDRIQAQYRDAITRLGLVINVLETWAKVEGQKDTADRAAYTRGKKSAAARFRGGSAPPSTHDGNAI
jgi:hypothetical protein